MKEYTTNQVQEKLNEDVTLIDVREADEVAQGIIPGALHIPLGLLEARMHELDKKETYIMVCRSGGRSGRAAELLESHGFTAINMAGGMLDWKGPVE